MPMSGGGAVVRLTLQGMSRVLDSRAGMVFVVDTFTNSVADNALIAHVRDERYQEHGRKYQIWTLGAGDFDMVIEPATGSGCECCDHKLQHAIREFLNTYDNAVPPLRVTVVVDGLRDALATWEGDK